MRQKRLIAVAAGAVLLLVAVVSVAMFRPRAKQTEKPSVPVKVAAVALNSASNGALLGHDHPAHTGGVGFQGGRLR
jgi:hypothetical protein